ncbi:MAG: alpha/beta fold hydrolase [Longimicrobiales bacterium]
MRATGPWPVLAAALLLIVGGDVLAWWIQTSGGDVDIRDVRWTGTDGTTMSGLLYVPDGATEEAPAPAVLAVHGYINSRETQDGFAIELSRRGYVVLAMDQTGHGYSDPPAFAHGFGGPDGLAYLRSLPFVDGDNVGLEGHSMGGWAVQLAAAAFPDGYRSIVLQGSSTGTSGAPAATAGTPRNLSVVFSEYDEFAALMWGVPRASDVPASPKLMEAFGTTRPVEPGRIYGSVEAGTARVLHQPPVIHPGDHFSNRAIGHAVEWFGITLEGGGSLPADRQVWIWKEVGNLLALVGMVLLLFPLGRLLLDLPLFAGLKGCPTVPGTGASGWGWWAAAAGFVVFPPLTLFPFKDVGGALTPNAVLPQGITNQIVVWALLVAALSAAGFAVWHVRVARWAGATLDDHGLTWEGRVRWRRVAMSALLAGAVALGAYATVVFSGAVFTTDHRFWVFAVKPMSSVQARAALGYVVPFTVFFVVYGTVLSGQLRRGTGLAGEAATAVVLSTVGFLGLIAVQYTPLFLGGTLAIASEPLWSIIAFQFVPIMTLAAPVAVYFRRVTGRIWVGAFLNGLLVTWIVVASQATHVAP